MFAGALIAIAFAFVATVATIEQNNSTKFLGSANNSRVDSVLNHLSAILNKNGSITNEDLKFEEAASNLSIGEIIDKLSNVGDKKNETIENVKRGRELEALNAKSYNVYKDESNRKDESNVGPIEESPDYASSVVLASDLLSLSRAVTNVKENVCREQGYKFLDGLLLKKRWALKMFDASAKSPQGLLFGSSYHLGNYDECVYITDSNDDGVPIEGQYCLATIDWPEAKEAKKVRGRRGPLRWAVCVPSTCNSSAVKDFVSDIITSTIGSDISVTITERDCSTSRSLNISNLDIAFLSIILMFAAIILLTSVYDYFADSLCVNKNSNIHNVIVSFSVINNIKKIMSTKQNTSLGLESIAGIKALAMFFILFGHALIFIISGPVTNPEHILEINRMLIYAFLLNNMLLVDTFLMLSAFLFSRLLLIELDKKKGKINFLPLLLFRYIRVTPAYLVVILFYMTWLPKIGDGPMWKERVELEQERCMSSWWTNILYVNNYVNTDKLCMFQSWYLSVDTQLFFIAPIFIYSLWRWRTVGLVLLSVASLISLIVPAVVTYKESLDPTLLIYADELRDLASNHYFNVAYIRTHMKMIPYFAGLLTGYLLHRIQTNNYQITKLINVIGWIICLICGAVTVFSINIFYQPWYEYSRAGAAAYISLHKLAWGISNSWLLIACATGNGGMFYKLFSWKFLIPLAKVTYSAYLVNGIVELYYAGGVQQPMHVTALTMGANAISHVMLTFLLALVLCVAFESPIHGIEKLLLRKFDHRALSDNVRRHNPNELSHKTSQN